MVNIVILGFDQVLATAITGVVDLLSLAGVSWNRIHKQNIQPTFNVQVASHQRASIQCINQLTLLPTRSFDDIRLSPSPDIVLIPTIGGPIERVLLRNKALINVLQSLRSSNSLICSNCTGAFLLAEAGLLEGKRATTHWGYQEQFRERYPDVYLEPENMLTHDGQLLCAGGGNAWFDLGLYLIERFCDHETAVETAKAFVIDFGRTSQLSYSPLLNKRSHRDDKIIQLQDWMEQNYTQPFSLKRLMATSHLSARTLHRRFKQATGVTPNAYLQLVRLEAAKKQLEQTHDSIEQITHKVGYNDLSSFSVLFKQKTGLTPRLYRERYQPG